MRAVALSRGLVLACAALFALCGCGGVSGTALPGEADTRKLDVGGYPTAVPRIASSLDPVGYARLEGVRLADAVMSPHEVDEKYSAGASAQVHTGVQTLTSYLAEPVLPVLQQHGFIVGFSTGSADAVLPLTRATEGSREREGLTVTVLRFPDKDAAKSAAAEMNAVDFGLSPDNAAVRLPKYPGSGAHWRPAVPTLGSTTAHGVFVISTLADARTTDLDRLIGITQKYLDAELPTLDRFTPTPTNQFGKLQQDPDRVLTRTLHPAGTVDPPDGQGEVVLSLRAYLNYILDQSGRYPVLRRAGVDRVAMTPSVFVFRTRDAAAAQRFVTESVELDNPADRRAFDPPEDVPDARCLQSYNVTKSAQFRCFVAYHEYAALIIGQQLLDTQQRAAAQYALFANTR
ncbi:hypothetical protein F5X71_32310 [Nocardia brasiliensis]|uniref:Uncharacterized protein n=1 Tax=Nocardia brasiliensis TaxID=37326 RepID=A0A6G9XZX3_NOCBR|nr:hypothetical protein [Nocardia brasiliensis]QIS06373.1 hypothetical protein F5X71_32310 [Nocardia brasiliensis]